MKFSFILIGKIKDKFLLEGIEKYKTLIRPFGEVEISFFEEVTYKKEPSKIQIVQGLDREAEIVLSTLDKQDFVIVLDLHGNSFDSLSFAQLIEKEKNFHSRIKFIIGSSYGISDKLRQRADLKLKISEMTFTHPMSLLIILEQVYRSCKLSSGQTYHK